MKNTKRLVFGVLSCLLLAVGFTQAADRLDPMNNNSSVQSADMDTSVRQTKPCIPPTLT